MAFNSVDFPAPFGPIMPPKKRDKDWAYHCLEKVGMAAYAKRQIGELSGGQQQRVFLARALAQKAELFCLDEPFVGIDVTSEEMIVSILKELRDEGKTVLVVHHDLSKADSYFNELILLNKELIQNHNRGEQRFLQKRIFHQTMDKLHQIAPLFDCRNGS